MKASPGGAFAAKVLNGGLYLHSVAEIITVVSGTFLAK